MKLTKKLSALKNTESWLREKVDEYRIAGNIVLFEKYTDHLNEIKKAIKQKESEVFNEVD